MTAEADATQAPSTGRRWNPKITTESRPGNHTLVSEVRSEL